MKQMSNKMWKHIESVWGKFEDVPEERKERVQYFADAITDNVGDGMHLTDLTSSTEVLDLIGELEQLHACLVELGK